MTDDEVPPDDPASSDCEPHPEPSAAECLNCGAELEGLYCAVCGQKRVDGRLRTLEIVKDLWSAALDLDRGFLHTFVGLTLRPGTTAREYVDGRRARHAPPFRYFLLLTAAWLAFPTLIGFDYAEYTARAMADASAGLESMHVEAGPMFRRFQEMSEVVYDARRWTMLTNLPLIALGGALLFRACRRTLAEWFAFSLFTSGHALLLGMAGFALLALEQDIAFQLLSLLTIPYMVWAYHQFAGENLGITIVKALLIFFFGGTSMFCGIYGIAFAVTG